MRHLSMCTGWAFGPVWWSQVEFFDKYIVGAEDVEAKSGKVYWGCSHTAGAVGPVVYAIAWDRCTGFAAGWCGAFFGMVGGVTSWLVRQQTLNPGSTSQQITLSYSG